MSADRSRRPQADRLEVRAAAMRGWAPRAPTAPTAPTAPRASTSGRPRPAPLPGRRPPPRTAPWARVRCRPTPARPIRRRAGRQRTRAHGAVRGGGRRPGNGAGLGRPDVEALGAVGAVGAVGALGAQPRIAAARTSSRSACGRRDRSADITVGLWTTGAPEAATLQRCLYLADPR